MILKTRATDVFLTASIDGAPANWLTPSLLAAGVDLDVLRTTLPGKIVAAQENKKRWKDIYTAGHGVGNIEDMPDRRRTLPPPDRAIQSRESSVCRETTPLPLWGKGDDVLAGLEEANRGNFATDEEVAATIAKFTKRVKPPTSP